MKVDVTKVLINLADGEPHMRARSSRVKPNDGKTEEVPMTLRWAVVDALLVHYPGEESLGGEEKMKRHALAEKIMANDAPDLSVEEASVMKTLLAKRWSTGIVGPAYKAIENMEEVKKDEVKNS